MRCLTITWFVGSMQLSICPGFAANLPSLFVDGSSIDPELMIRMLVVGHFFAIRSERLICREVQVKPRIIVTSALPSF
jgi:transposase